MRTGAKQPSGRQVNVRSKALLVAEKVAAGVIIHTCKARETGIKAHVRKLDDHGL